MPIVYGDKPTLAPIGPQEHAPDVGFLEQANAMFQTGTFSGSTFRLLLDQEKRSGGPRDPDFNVLDHLTPDELAEPLRFGGANSLEDLEVIREQRRRLDRTLEMAASGPVNPFMLQLGVNLFDVANWVGLGLTGGTSLAARVVVSGAENALSSAALTGIQSTYDPDVTSKDVAIATAAGGAIGTVFRAAVGAAGKAYAARKLRDLGNEAAGLVNDKRTIFQTPESLSAAVNGPDLPPEFTKQVKSFRFATKTGDTGLLPVGEELANSDIPAVRQALYEMYDTGTITKGELIGERMAEPSLHTQIKAADAQLVELNRALKLAFDEGRRKGTLPKNMSFAEFDEALGVAMHTGDTSPHPAVQDIAQRLRKDLMEPYRKRIDASGIRDLPAAPKGAESYFPHNYVVERIERGWQNDLGQTFEEALADHFRRTDPDNAEYAESIAEEVVAKILRLGRVKNGDLARFSLSERGPLKERTLEVPYSVLRPWLNNSATIGLGRYVKSVAPDLAIFEKYGSLDAEKALAPRVNAQADAMRKAIMADSTLKEEARGKRLADLRAHQDRMLDLLRFAFDELRGVRGEPGTSKLGRGAIKSVKTASFIRSLPLVALAQLPDMGNVVIKEGMVRTFGSALHTMVKSLQLKKTMSLREAQAMGAALENQLNTRMNTLFALGDHYSAGNRYERRLAKANNLAARLFGLNAMTVGTKSIAAGAATARIMDDALAVEKAAKKILRETPNIHPQDLSRRAAAAALGKADLRRMAQNRLTGEDLLAIAKQKRHFSKYEANSDKWDDPKAMKAYRLALSAAVENAVITPTAIDAPMWASTATGSVLLTYKRFLYASYHRIMVAGLQQRDTAALMGAVTMLGMGALSLTLRDIATTGDIKDRTTAQWVYESVDRSGLAAGLFEAQNWAEAFSIPTMETLVGRAGMAPTLEGRLAGNTFFKSGPTEQAAGPLGGYVSDVAKTIGLARKAAAGKEITESDVHRATRLIPFRNFIGLSLAFDQLEHAGAKAGWYEPLPDKSK